MSDSSVPAPRTPPESATPAMTPPLLLRLEDLPAYGSSEVEPAPLKTRLMIGAAILLAISIGAFLGLRPYLLRQQLMAQMDRQIAAGEFTAAQTIYDRFAGRFPEHPELRRYAGLLALSQAEWTRAEDLLGQQVARYPEDQAANLALGYLYGLEVIYQQAPATDLALRRALITDWTRLFGLSIAGVDPAAPALGLATTAPAQDAMKVLRRARDVPGDKVERTLPQAALWSLDILLAPTPEAGAPAVAELSQVEGVNMPAFMSFQILRPQLADLTIPQPQTPPAPLVPGAAGIPNLPPPGEIIELPSDGSALPPGPAFQLPMRGGGNLGDILDAEGGFDAPLEGTSGGGASEVASELKYPGGMGIGPRVRPAETGSYKRQVSGGGEEDVWYVRVINLREAGNMQGRPGETLILPNTGHEVTIESISDEGRRVVLREKGRGIFVFVHYPGAKWQWDGRAPENDGGELRKNEHRPVAERTS